MNSSLSFINKPIKISGIGDLTHKYSNFFFDLDGVIWTGQNSIQDSMEALNFLKQQNKRLFYITNNSTQNRQQVQKKFIRLGFEPQLNDIYTSSSITAIYLKERHPDIRHVAVVGTLSLVKDIQSAGVTVLHINQVDETLSFKQLAENCIDSRVEALVMGYDKNLTYNKICLLSLYLQKGAKFIGTNPDKYTMLHGYRAPGCGSLLACVESACGKKPEIVGKPNEFILDFLIQKQNLRKKECLMIGDNLQTDILFGQRGGIDSLCTLTGVATEELILANSIVTPTYYCDRLL